MGSAEHSSPITLTILPLQELSGDPRIAMFCTGLRMDLTTDLSRFRSFQVIPMDNLESIHLNLDYVVKGIVRCRDEMLQINLQLIHAKDNRLVWAEKFGNLLEHIFQIEEEIVQKIVISLQQVVDADLLGSIRKRSFTNLNAYESWLYGMEELKKGTLQSDIKARTFFREAIDKDAGFARAYTGMSLTYFNEWSCLLWDKWDENQKNAIEWALKAVELDSWDPSNAFILGKCFLFYKQFNKAEYHLRRALELSPLDPKLLAGIAFCLTYLGYAEEGLALVKKAGDLDPSHDGFFLTNAFIYFENGLFEEAIEMGEKIATAAEWIDFSATMAAAYYYVGDTEKMWQSWKSYVQYFQQKIRPDHPLDEKLALQWMMQVNPYQHDTKHQSFWDYLSAGLGISDIHEEKEKTYSQTNEVVKEGKVWNLSYQGKSVQMPEVKGLYDLVRLMETPHMSIHSADLMGLKVLETGAPVLDERAKLSYQKQLLSIQESLTEAEQMQDPSAIERLQTAYDELLTHLSRSVGKGGNTRQTSSSLEKARSAVTWRIRAAIRKIEEIHPILGRHLKLSIKTGLFCSYEPERETDWLIVGL